MARGGPAARPGRVSVIRPVLLGESIAPFRLLGAATCVLPLQQHGLLDSKAAADAGHRYLAAWLRDIEAKWRQYCSKRPDGSPRMTLSQQLDYMRKLTLQLPVAGTRVVDAKAGTLFAATIITDQQVLIDHMAYWAAARNMTEARYLTAVLNSDFARSLIEPMQPKGQGGARHFDNLIWELPIPEYDRSVTLHRELAADAEQAERVVASVPLREGAYFTQSRARVRERLIATGVAKRIDALVERLLDGG